MTRKVEFVNSSVTDWALNQFGGLIVPQAGTEPGVLDVTDLIGDSELVNAIQNSGLNTEFTSERYLRINGEDYGAVQSANYGSLDQDGGIASIGGSGIHTKTSEPTGFPNRTDSIISFNNGSRKFEIEPSGSSFDFYMSGVKYTKSVLESVVIGDTEGVWYIYYTSGGALTAGQVFWNLATTAPIAILYWDTANNAALIFADERHGLTMDWSTHKYLHFTIGTRFSDGLATAGNIAGDGSVDSHAQVSMSPGTVFDEDLEINISDGVGGTQWEQDLSLPAKIPVYYRDGAGGNWRKQTTTSFPLIPPTTNRIKWNQDVAGTWQLTEVSSNGNYLAMWLYATNNIAEPIIAIVGQREDVTLTNALLNNTLDSLALGSAVVAEMKIIAKIIYQTSASYGNSVKARLRNIVDMRSVSNLPGGTYVASDHGSLSGLTNQDHPASAIFTNVANFNDALSAADDDVQKALETLDDAGIYGAQFQEEADDTEESTTSTTYASKVLLTTPSIPNGTYRIGFSFEWTSNNESSGNEMKARIYVDGATTVNEVALLPRIAMSNWTGNIFPASGFAYVVLTGGPTVHTFDLQWSGTGVATVRIRRARLELWRAL